MWAKIKQYTHEHNTEGNVTVSKLKELKKILLQLGTPGKRSNICKYTIGGFNNFFGDKDDIFEDDIDWVIK